MTRGIRCGLGMLGLAVAAFAAGSTLTEGIAALEQGRYREARELLLKAMEAEPADSDARTFFALANAATGRCGEAEAPLRAVATSSNHLARLSGLAAVQCMLARNATSEASALLGFLRERHPGDADVLYLSAKLHLKAWNEDIEQLFARAPASYRVNQLSGEILELQGKFSEAVEEYRKAIAKNAQAVNLHYRLGRALLLAAHGEENLGAAKREFEAELALNPEDSAAEYQVGLILQAQGNAGGGLMRFERALALRPDFGEALLAVGKARLTERRYPEAIALLKRVTELQPRSEAGRYNLMLAYRNSGATAEAEREQREIEKLRRPAGGEFADFLKRIGEKPAAP